MRAEIIVRGATTSDALAVGGVNLSAWCRAYVGIMPDSALSGRGDPSADEWARILGKEGRSNAVAVLREEIVGYASWRVCAAEDGDPNTCVELIGLYVEPRHWRLGV